MRFEQITIRLTPMPRNQVAVAIVSGVYDAPKKPHLELIADEWLEPDAVASFIDPWVRHAAQLGYGQPPLDIPTSIGALPLRPPH